MRLYLLKSKMVPFFFIILTLLLAEFGYPQQEADISKYPSRPINLIVQVPAGGATDMAFRLIAKEAEKFIGQPIVIVNKPGGGGSVGLAAIAAAKPDGYTIGNAGHTALFVLPYFEKLPYHPIEDIRGIIQFGALNFGIYIKGDSPLKTHNDLITYSRQNPKKVTYGTIGPNSFQYIVVEEIAKKENIQFTHIPFKGASEIQTAVLGGHIFFGVSDLNYAMIEAGEIRLLLLLREEKSLEYPQVPILKDFGYNIPTPTAINISGPKKIPDAIAKKLEEAFTKAIKEPAFVKGMKDLGLPIVYRNSKDFNEYTSRNYEVFGTLLKKR